MAKPPDLYNQDFYAWALTTSELMRRKKWLDIDWDVDIEEIAGLAGRNQCELASRLDLLVMHLLKWNAEPQGQQLGHSWRDTIDEQRSAIEILLDIALRSVVMWTPFPANSIGKPASGLWIIQGFLKRLYRTPGPGPTRRL